MDSTYTFHKGKIHIGKIQYGHHFKGGHLITFELNIIESQMRPFSEICRIRNTVVTLFLQFKVKYKVKPQCQGQNQPKYSIYATLVTCVSIFTIFLLTLHVVRVLSGLLSF